MDTPNVVQALESLDKTSSEFSADLCKVLDEYKDWVPVADDKSDAKALVNCLDDVRCHIALSTLRPPLNPL